MRPKSGTRLWADDATPAAGTEAEVSALAAEVDPRAKVRVTGVTSARAGMGSSKVHVVFADEDGSDAGDDAEYQDLTDRIVEGRDDNNGAGQDNSDSDNNNNNDDDDDDDDEVAGDKAALGEMSAMDYLRSRMKKSSAAGGDSDDDNEHSSSSSASGSGSGSGSGSDSESGSGSGSGSDAGKRSASKSGKKKSKKKVKTNKGEGAGSKADSSVDPSMRVARGYHLVSVANLSLKVSPDDIEYEFGRLGETMSRHLIRVPGRPPTQTCFLAFRKKFAADKALKREGKLWMGRELEVKICWPDEADPQIAAAMAEAPAHAAHEEDIGDSGRLFVRNLSYDVTDAELRALFEPHGDLAEVHVPVDRDTRRTKGFAYVLFVMPADAVRAYEALDATIFQGRIMHVLPARNRAEWDEAMEATDASFKSQRERGKKTDSMRERSWNALFMGADAVAAATAEGLGVSKSELLDRGADSVAVRLALGETQVIAETKRFFEENGISMDALGEAAAGRTAGAQIERSDRALLVKNTPHGTTEAEIRAAFAKFGPIDRVLVPPAKTIAIVEFAVANDAKSAFRSMAFRKFKKVPMFLEWVPTSVFEKRGGNNNNNNSNNKSDGTSTSGEQEGLVSEEVAAGAQKSAKAPSEDPDGADADADAAAILVGDRRADEEDSVETHSVFVKGLNFTTTDDTLRRVFETVGPLRSARVARKRDPHSSESRSLGYGFVEFKSKERAKVAVHRLAGKEIDGHRVEVSLSQRKTGSVPGAASTGGAGDAADGRRKRAAPGANPPSSKLVVRNLAFQATKRELRDLFGTFGEIKSVRIPKKFDGTHRGFAFVEFLTTQDAKAATASLAATHLYGRHLVIEYAAEDDDMDALREKTVKYFERASEAHDSRGKRPRTGPGQ
jgi:multiple RNA-binding domain-containing protein 1